MALPPTDAYFYFDEPTSDFRGQLYNRGIPRSNITYECSPHFSHQAKVTRYTIIDATRPNKFTEAEEIIDILLAFDCTKENLQQVMDFFHPPVMLAFADEQSCLEYLYVVISQELYGAFLDFDESEAFSILQAYRQNENTSCGIINCVDLKHLETIPMDKEIFFTNIFPNTEEAYPILITDKFHKVLEMFAPTSSGTIIFAPYHKQSEKLFWSE